MCKWKEAHDLGLWGTDAEQVVFAVFKSFAMANSKDGPKTFAPKDFMLHYEQQQQAGGFKPTARDKPMTKAGFYRFAASVRAFNPQRQSSE